ncbi:hypothetical protein PybrP1_003097 [[Pythium] brassicae (nom. inval.)]|nr:hypothetical protein PybrP1_003097 [[Pythium] brassicae (nom. inval.)]
MRCAPLARGFLWTTSALVALAIGGAVIAKWRRRRQLLLQQPPPLRHSQSPSTDSCAREASDSAIVALVAVASVASLVAALVLLATAAFASAQSATPGHETPLAIVCLRCSCCSTTLKRLLLLVPVALLAAVNGVLWRDSAAQLANDASSSSECGLLHADAFFGGATAIFVAAALAQTAGFCCLPLSRRESSSAAYCDVVVLATPKETGGVLGAAGAESREHRVGGSRPPAPSLWGSIRTLMQAAVVVLFLLGWTLLTLTLCCRLEDVIVASSGERPSVDPTALSPKLMDTPNSQHLNGLPVSTQLELSGWLYVSAHATLMLTHTLCAAFLIGSARLYWFMEHPYLTYFVDLLAPKQDRHFKFVGTALGGLGVLHVLLLFGLLAPRAVRKHLKGYPPALRTWNARTAIGAAIVVSPSVAAPRTRQWVPAALRQYFADDGAFGANSRHIAWISVVMEVTQIATQVYQAHRSSHLISRLWINRCYVAIAALFCWATPLLHYFLRNRPSAERVACLAVDALLNISYSIILPLVIFIPYLYRYDTEAYSFDVELLYDDQGFGSLVLENQSIFAVSLLDCGSKLVPHAIHVTKGKLFYVAIRLVFVGLGTAIFAIHLASLQRLDGISTLGCKQTMHPWFSTKYSCSVFEFNCYRHGVESPALDSFDSLDEHTLSSLLISHCPALVVPPAIRSFPNLLGIEIYNSTIVQWTAEAAISATIHKKMVYLLLCLVNMTALPEGVLDSLPDMLQDIEISLTNLTSLPDDLHEHWHSLSVLYVEKSEIRVFPSTLLHLEVFDLSLIGNQITEIDALAVAQSSYYVLALSHNPLRTLPPSLPETLTISFLGLEGTKLGALPNWVDTQVNELVYLSSPTMCPRAADDSDVLRLG